MRRTLILWRLVRSQNPSYSRCLLHLPVQPFSKENPRIFQKCRQALSWRALSTQDPKTGIIKSEFPSVPVANQSFADTLLSKIWQHSVEQPNRPAFISAEDPEDFITYQQLYLSSYSISTFLDSVGFGRGDIACAVLPICWQFMGIFIGCAIQGGAISGANNQYTHLELERQFNDSKCKIVFCADNCLEKVITAVKNCRTVEKIVVVPTSRDCSVESLCISDDIIPFSAVLSTKPNIRKPEFDVDVERDILLMPYSSGTTGPPKGVMLTHKSFGSMMNVYNWHFDHQVLYKMDPKWDWKTGYQCFILPLYHIYGIGITTNCILAGGCGILLKQFDGQIFCKTIQNYKISHAQLVPPILLFLAKSPVISKYDLSSIKYIMTGAAPAGAEICDEVMKRLPSIEQISQGYGMTEESMASHLPVFGMQNTAAAGKLMSNLEMKIVDIESRKPLPLGATGEICIRGPTIMLGYLNRPDCTAEVIDEEGWLKTGDIGYQDEEGWTYVVDRLKELIKVKGFQVAPAELEDLLLSHHLIQDVAVIGIPDKVSGEVPKAFVVKTDPSLTEKDVMDFVKDKVAVYKQLKGGVEFLDSIPKTPSGKILRRMLRK
ncbi:AMP-binding enzyme domain-containing protein [Ditylenchus destructor]|nr:AMP-binding enzyme domain-containing protein [Ditylenchus destructor]